MNPQCLFIMTPSISESLLRLRRLQKDLQFQFLSTFYIFCDLKEAMIELQEAQTLSKQQGASSKYLARMRSILQSIQVLQDSVASLLNVLTELAKEF